MTEPSIRPDPFSSPTDPVDTAEAHTTTPSEPPTGAEPRSEKRLSDVVFKAMERGIEAGLGTMLRTDEAVRGAFSEAKMPREILTNLKSQFDDTKSMVTKAVARELHQFLENTDLSREMVKVLTALSFEIRTEVRFIPNDAGTGVKPDIKAGRARMRRSSAPPPESATND